MKIAKQYDNGKLTIYLYGELDHHAASAAMTAISEMICEDLPRRVALDCGGLNFMDSSGIALILRINRMVGLNRGEMWVERPNRQVLRVLEASGIGRLVTITADIAKE